ncbi:chaplin, partial [Streptomyces sp. BE308]|uniref:chaplin n=1 Tax=Streptomyces sp. BE308 TaxID=3002529 RepID=UPI002E76C1D3
GLIAAGAGAASATGHSGADSHGTGPHTPGLATGHLAQDPVHIPVNDVGNTVDEIGLLNPAFGNYGLNH